MKAKEIRFWKGEREGKEREGKMMGGNLKGV